MSLVRIQDTNGKTTSILKFVLNNSKDKIKFKKDESKYISLKTDPYLVLKRLFKEMKESKIVLDISEINLRHKQMVLNIAERYLYKFNKYNTNSSRPSLKDKKNKILVYDVNSDIDWILKKNIYITFTRDIINEPANVATPEYISLLVKKNLKNAKVIIYNKDQIIKKGLNLVYAVGKGSMNDPRFVVIEYFPKNKVNTTICLCGKGVVFDAGGTQIKTGTSNSYAMKADKTGGCIVIGLMKYFSDMEIPCNMVGVIPLVENVVSGSAIMPGDIYTSYSGKTVEILNTDAEGRLILADALSYCEKYNPDYIFDFATLTGWASKLHCDIAAAFYSPNAKLHRMIEDIGEECGDRTWGMPKWLEYKSYCKSKVADLKNYDLSVDGCTAGGGYMAAMFLAHFVPSRCIQNWVHFDICNNIDDHIMNANTMNLAINLIKTLVYNK
jgi:leucyl aminopeptidase